MKRSVKITLWLLAVVLLATLILGYVYYFKRAGTIPRTSVDKDSFPVAGVDLSSHNGEVDFSALAHDGIEFVYLKATEGATYKDSHFHDNYTRARQARLMIGVYHFFRFETNGQMQAINILNSLRHKRIDLPVAIDVEEWTNQADMDTKEINSNLRELVDYLRAHDIEVMIYTNIKGYYRFYRNSFEDCPLWICSFTNPPLDDPRAKPLFWQHSHLGSVTGCSGFVDLDTFYGSRAMWDAWLAARK